MSISKAMRLFNGLALGVWVALLPPTILWWLESIPWVVFMSWYAIAVTHLGAFIASRVEVKQDEQAS